MIVAAYIGIALATFMATYFYFCRDAVRKHKDVDGADLLLALIGSSMWPLTIALLGGTILLSKIHESFMSLAKKVENK
jgi:hypothetical protein